MPTVLIVGGTRGLGAALVSFYASQSSTTVVATSRSAAAPNDPSRPNVHWVTSIDLMRPSCGEDIASPLKDRHVDTVIISAGYFPKEEFDEGPNWEDEVRTYTTSSIAPPFIIHSLVKRGIVREGGKVVLVSSEAGSITLRIEGGGDFAHHGSKAALNMVGKQLSFDLKDKGIAVVMVHPSFMRTEMTRNVGFDKFWDSGGALTPKEAAQILGTWVDNEFTMKLTGTFWAPRGTRDIGTWNDVMGKETATKSPVQIPW